MAIAAHVYGQFLNGLSTKTINLSTDTLKVMLVTSSYTPNQASDTFANTPGASEITGTGYTAGGVTLSSVTTSDSSDIFTLSAANVSWTSATFTTRYAILYDTTVGVGYSTNPLVGYIDFGANQSPSGVTFAINWSGGQVLQFTAS